MTLFVADISSPSTISALTTTLQSTGQLLAGETAANFFADDVLDVAQTRSVASYLSSALASRHLSDASVSALAGSVSGSRKDRTVDLCVTNSHRDTALAAAQQLSVAMTTGRARFIGPLVARRVFVKEVSAPAVRPAPSSRNLLNLVLRLMLGVLIALGLALLWDALDRNVRNQRDVEAALRVPVLASTRK